MMSAADSIMFSDIIGTRIQDETGAKYTVLGVQNGYIILQDTLDNETLVNLDRYDEMVTLPINNPKKWEEIGPFPYTISAWRA